ncbi:MAG: hypothetical protein AAGI66_08560, partial [Cyanobacteria bacterium P01_H01_bin.74]
MISPSVHVSLKFTGNPTKRKHLSKPGKQSATPLQTQGQTVQANSLQKQSQSGVDALLNVLDVAQGGTAGNTVKRDSQSPRPLETGSLPLQSEKSRKSAAASRIQGNLKDDHRKQLMVINRQLTEKNQSILNELRHAEYTNYCLQNQIKAYEELNVALSARNRALRGINRSLRGKNLALRGENRALTAELTKPYTNKTS